MHFCSDCKNMYYIRISSEDPNKLIYYCRNCGNEDTTITVDNVNVSKISLKQKTNTFYNINKYTKLDPTLPRIKEILCPNTECLTNTSNEPREIIYMRYDDTNMKYVYLCSSCDKVWTMEQK